MWEKIKEIYAGLFLIFACLWILLHLVWIKLRGQVVIAEDNKWILKAELVLMSLLVFLGIERLIKDLISLGIRRKNNEFIYKCLRS